MLDSTERQILALLQADGRMANVELAEQIGLSESPTFRRTKQLQSSGVIRGFAAIVDQRMLGLDVTAYVQVTMEKQPDTAIDAFLAAVQAEPHIMECYAMSGSYDYLMKVVARSIDHFSELVMLHVESSFSLKEIKLSHVLPT